MNFFQKLKEKFVSTKNTDQSSETSEQLEQKEVQISLVRSLNKV